MVHCSTENEGFTPQVPQVPVFFLLSRHTFAALWVLYVSAGKFRAKVTWQGSTPVLSGSLTLLTRFERLRVPCDFGSIPKQENGKQ